MYYIEDADIQGALRTINGIDGGTLVGSENTSRQAWRDPLMPETWTTRIGAGVTPVFDREYPAPALEAWSFGIIMVWAMVLAAFLSDYCWGRTRL
jgi:hypothetical protein